MTVTGPEPEPAREAQPEPDDPTVPDTGWSVVVEVDEAFYATHDPVEPGSPPLDLPEGSRQVELHSEVVLIGRGDGVAVDLSLPPADPAVSHRHATLHRRDDSWVLVDEGSKNGTRLVSGGDPVTPGAEVPLDDGDYVLVGAWTRLTLRRSGDRPQGG